MSDWQVGDLAVCVDDQPRDGDVLDLDFATLRAGRLYRVANVCFGGLGLHVAEAPVRRKAGWWADRFRKIRPDEHQACEPEFVKLLKRSKRKAPEHAWLTTAADQVRQWRDEDRRNGIVWEDQQ